MNVSQLIEKHLQNSNMTAAFELYERNPCTLSWKASMELARAYFTHQDYEKVLKVLSQTSPQTYTTAYEHKMLQLKSQYLSGLQIKSILQELQAIVDRDVFQVHHRNTLSEMKQILSVRDIQRSNIDLQSEGEAFEKIYKKDEVRGALAYQGFPIFLIAKSWLMRWRVYVFLEPDHLQRAHPGPITQFQLLDHPYNILYDNNKQKQYTNRYIFEGVEYELLTKECWQYLQKRYGGIPISRLNISLYEKPTQTVTEVYLKKILIGRNDRPTDKYWVQICRKELWQGLTKKIEQSWGQGRLWKMTKNSKVLVNLNAVLQDEDISNIELIYEIPVNGLWPFGDSQPIKATPLQTCANCGKSGKLRFCSCRIVKYCDMKCLENHRYKHRRVCESRKQQQKQVNSLLSKFNLSNDEVFAGCKGLVGLRNLGNTCYMNAGIQCLSNTREFTEYFMTNRFLREINSNNPLGSGGQIACCYSKLIREMWTGREQDVSPWELKKVISNFSPQFAGYGQHDSQQLISTLVDALHEDTNTVKVKPAVQIEDDDNRTDEQGSRLSSEAYLKRNMSWISDLTAGQFKSTAKCPCGRISKSFDPFMLISLPIPQPSQVYIFFVAKDNTQLPLKLSVIVSGNDTVQDIIPPIQQIAKLSTTTNLKFYGIDNKFKITCEFKASDRADTMRTPYYVFAYEINTGVNDELVRIDYLTEQRGELSPSYPRFVSIPRASLSQELATQIVLKDAQKYGRTQRTVVTRDMLQVSISSGCIKVVVKSKELLLQSHKTHREDIEVNKQGGINLNDCLSLFQKEEKLDKDNSWYCNKCKQFVQAQKKIEIYKANKILMLGLKRFRLGRKLKSQINFPIDSFDMGPYIVGNTDRKPVLYDLYAVSNHYGTMLGGHYTAFCKNFISGKWFEFNDSRVSKISQEDVVSSGAYVLFYRRRD